MNHMARTLGFSTGTPNPVLSITEMREAAPQVAKSFREDGLAADVVFFGSQRRFDGALIPAALFTAFADVLEDLVIAQRVRERRETDTGVRFTLDEVDEMLGHDPAAREADLAALRAELGLT